jgi:hypothetical protein
LLDDSHPLSRAADPVKRQYRLLESQAVTPF